MSVVFKLVKLLQRAGQRSPPHHLRLEGESRGEAEEQLAISLLLCVIAASVYLGSIHVPITTLYTHM